MTQSKRFAIVGLFEDYAHRRPSPVTELGCYGGDPIKERIASHYGSLPVAVVRDSICVAPSMWAYGIESLALHLSYLYTSLAHETALSIQQTTVLTLRCVLDEYAEITMYHRRKKWLEPLIQETLLGYDAVFYLTSNRYRLPESLKLEERYNLRLRNLMTTFKAKYVAVKDENEIYEYIASATKIHGVEKKPDSGNTEAPSGKD